MATIHSGKVDNALDVLESHPVPEGLFQGGSMKNMFLILFFFFASAHALAAPYKVALNWKPEPQFGGFYEAERAGSFKKHALEVQILEGGSGTPTVQMLAHRKVDFAVVSAEEILISNDKNPKSPLVAVFASFQTSPSIIMTHADRNFQSLKEVFASPGVIAIQSGLSQFQYLLKKFGPPKAKIVPYLGGITNFLQDKNYSQQGFLSAEPLAAEKAGRAIKSFLISNEGFNPYLTVVAVRRELLEKNGKAVTAFVHALREGWNQYLTNPDPANQLMGQLNKSMDSETFKKSAQAQAGLIKDKKSLNFKIGSMTEERWLQLINQMAEMNFIKTKIPAKSVFENL